jgi:hypothetical protein
MVKVTPFWNNDNMDNAHDMNSFGYNALLIGQMQACAKIEDDQLRNSYTC